jgi:hypothetical protein
MNINTLKNTSGIKKNKYVLKKFGGVAKDETTLCGVDSN